MSWLSQVPDSAWWDLVPAAIGAVIGALAGGVPPYLIAIRSSNEILKREEEIAMQNNRARLFRTFSAVHHMVNASFNTLELIRSMQQSGSCMVGDHAPTQRYIREIANLEFENYIVLSHDDIGLLFDNEKSNFANDLIDATNKYNAVLNCVRTFNREKEVLVRTLTKSTSEHKVGPDGLTISKLSRDEKAEIMLLEARCESVIKPTIENLFEVCSSLVITASEFVNTAKACLPSNSQVVGFPKSDIDKMEELLIEHRSALSNNDKSP